MVYFDHMPWGGPPSSDLQQVLKLCKRHKGGGVVGCVCVCVTSCSTSVLWLRGTKMVVGIWAMWKVTPGASVGFQTRPAKLEAETMHCCSRARQRDVGREAEWQRVWNRKFKKEKPHLHNNSPSPPTLTAQFWWITYWVWVTFLQHKLIRYSWNVFGSWL